MAECKVSGCERPAKNAGMCWKHYHRVRNYGSPAARPKPSPLGKLLEHLNVPAGKPDECWEWTGYRVTQGYGRFMADRRVYHTHRASYELFWGPIPKGQFVLHLCDNPPCCNPRHLMVGTAAENARQREERNRRHKLCGEDAPQSKLTAAQVREIRRRFGTGANNQKELARLFGVAQPQIHMIVRRKAWTHLEEEQDSAK